MSTPTPRTDAAVKRLQFIEPPHDLHAAFAEFARGLERELYDCAEAANSHADDAKNARDAQRSYWATGAVIRMCGCAADQHLVAPCLPVLTNGRDEWTHCPTCRKTWDTRTMKERCDPAGICDWEENENGWWGTDCNNAFEFTNGSPTHNKFKFCPYCGKLITETPYSKDAG